MWHVVGRESGRGEGEWQGEREWKGGGRVEGGERVEGGRESGRGEGHGEVECIYWGGRGHEREERGVWPERSEGMGGEERDMVGGGRQYLLRIII